MKPCVGSGLEMECSGVVCHNGETADPRFLLVLPEQWDCRALQIDAPRDAEQAQRPCRKSSGSEACVTDSLKLPGFQLWCGDLGFQGIHFQRTSRMLIALFEQIMAESSS